MEKGSAPMKRTRLFLVLVLALLSSAPFLRGQQNEIIGIEQIGNSRGIAYTRDTLYLTHDDGLSWIEARAGREPGESIAGASFITEKTGWVILADHQNGRLRLAKTDDGGVTWRQRPLDLPPDDLVELSLDRVEVSAAYSDDQPYGTGWLQFVATSSSNFTGSVIYQTNDGGRSWHVSARFFEPRTGEVEFSERIFGENVIAWSQWNQERWRITSTGGCAGIKTGCFQETKLRRLDGKDITPPQIKQRARIEKKTAEQEAITQLFVSPPGGSTRISLNRGFDKCTAATVAQMQTWWNNSPLYDANIYISGRNRGCSQPQLSASWVNQVSAMGWGLIPTIVGYQSPCSSCATCQKHSSDAATAETQGRGEADIAVADATNLGLTAGSILYYDMERYDETAQTPGCRTATTAFLKGWTERVRELGYKSGAYGSPRNAIDDWQFMPPASRMEVVWMARWDNVPSVWTYVSFPTFPNNVWDNHQRIKQWQAPHDETWGGVTFNIDGNIADGPVAGVAVTKNKNADFDGDGKTDVSVFRSENGVWYVLNSSNATVTHTPFGQSGDVPSPGDYDGDGRTDPAVFRPSDGIWHLLMKANTYSARQWGANGDIPVAGDYNGDGKTDVAVWRPSNGIWYIVNSDSLGTFTGYGWGTTGDKPVVGDYDGDGKSDIAIYRPSNGTWYAVRSSDGGFSTTLFGLSADLPAQGDFDGDGKTDHVVFRPSEGVWYILRSSDGVPNSYAWGVSGDLPVTGDYDGDNKADVGLFRPSNGGWYVIQSGGGFQGATWGAATDSAVPNAYLPR